jgi:hypothetical protein
MGFGQRPMLGIQDQPFHFQRLAQARGFLGFFP